MSTNIFLLFSTHCWQKQFTKLDTMQIRREFLKIIFAIYRQRFWLTFYCKKIYFQNSALGANRVDGVRFSLCNERFIQIRAYTCIVHSQRLFLPCEGRAKGGEEFVNGERTENADWPLSCSICRVTFLWMFRNLPQPFRSFHREKREFHGFERAPNSRIMCYFLIEIFFFSIPSNIVFWHGGKNVSNIWNMLQVP